MRTFSIRREYLIFGVSMWWLLFVVLSTLQFNPFEILDIFGFPTLLLLPGALTMIALRMRGMPLWAYLGLAVGFSVFELMAVGLLGNMFWPALGVVYPLTSPVLLEELSLMVLTLSLIAYSRMGRDALRMPTAFFESAHDRIIALSPAIFVAMASIGAIELNNGASDIITLSMLIAMAAFAGLLIYRSPKLGENVIPTSLFFMALAVLLMNSLRGWYITGHDIQREYQVFELAKEHGLWAIASYRDAYNACLSITILPTIFSNLLSLADPYIFKILFQVIFATSLPMIYLAVRRYVSATVAFLSTFYFIAFPTFFTDMSFLNRQEIAFVFLALMIFVIFERSLSLRLRRALFLIFGVSMVLSHYATTYTIVAALIFLACMQPVIVYAGPWLRKRGWFSRSAIPALSQKDFIYKPLITFWMVLVLAGASFLWSDIVTNTASGSIVSVVESTFAALKSSTKEDAQSSDVNSSLFSYRTVDYQMLLDRYQTAVVAPIRAAAPAGTYYATSSYAQYPLSVAPDESVPLTPIGSFLSSVGINVANDNSIFREASAKLLQVLIIIGFLVVAFSSAYIESSLDTEFALLAVASLIMLAAIVVLPVLSIEYGLLRAFQQSLMFLGVFLVMGSLAVMGKRRRAAVIFASALLIIFFLSETGVFTQIFGGYSPQLDLNDSGLYYDIYYPHETEVYGLNWLSARVSGDQDKVQMPTQSNFYAFDSDGSITDLNQANDIFPELVRKDSYVLLDYTVVHKGVSIITYSGTQITYTYPVQFLDDNKDLIYNNGDVKIYR